MKKLLKIIFIFLFTFALASCSLFPRQTVEDGTYETEFEPQN